MKQITLGFSPCPNDTFIFDALVNGSIDTGKYRFVPHLADVEELNKMALGGMLDVTKISVASYPAISEHYIILESGSALGKGVGPIVVAKSNEADLKNNQTTAAIPGFNTTANLLLSIFHPEIVQKDFLKISYD